MLDRDEILKEAYHKCMAEMYAKMVQRGIKDINDVPAAFREEVKRLLGMNEEDAE